MLHTVTTSGLIKHSGMMFWMRASSSLARKGSMCSGAFRCAGIQNAKNLSLQTTNLSRLSSFTARNVSFWNLVAFWAQSLFTLWFSAIATCIGIFQQLSINPPFRALHRNAREKLNFWPVVHVYSDLLPGESWNKLKIPRRNGSPSPECTPVYRASWTEGRLQFPVPTSVNINCSSFHNPHHTKFVKEYHWDLHKVTHAKFT